MILVCGATGRVGREVVRELMTSGAPLRCLVRDATRARAVLGTSVDLARGDFDDAQAMVAALRGITRMFMMSPIGPDLAAQQLRALEAAAAAGVERIVKLSGSSWTMEAGHMTSTGAAHASVEDAIAATGIAHAFVRPNAFMQGMLSRIPEQLALGDSLTLALGEARAALIDVRDIAAVAARALVAVTPLDADLRLSGPEACSGNDLAVIASVATGREIRYRAMPIEAALAGARARGDAEYLQRHLREVLELMGRGAAAGITETVARVCGRPGRSVDAWLRAALTPAAQTGLAPLG